MINWLPPYKTVAEYMQMDSMLNESSASEICQWCHRLCRSITMCKMQAVSPCTCSEKTPDLSPHTHRERSKPPKTRIRLFIKLLSTKTRQEATLPFSYIHFLFMLITQKRSCIRSHCWSIRPHNFSLTVAKTWRLEMSKRTEKVYRMYSLRTHLASDKLYLGDFLAQ